MISAGGNRRGATFNSRATSSYSLPNPVVHNVYRCPVILSRVRPRWEMCDSARVSQCRTTVNHVCKACVSFFSVTPHTHNVRDVMAILYVVVNRQICFSKQEYQICVFSTDYVHIKRSMSLTWQSGLMWSSPSWAAGAAGGDRPRRPRRLRLRHH